MGVRITHVAAALAVVYALSGASCGSNPAATGGGGGPTGAVPSPGELRPVPGVWLIAPYVDSDERRWKGLMELNYAPGSTAQYTGVIHWKSDDGEDQETAKVLNGSISGATFTFTVLTDNDVTETFTATLSTDGLTLDRGTETAPNDKPNYFGARWQRDGKLGASEYPGSPTLETNKLEQLDSGVSWLGVEKWDVKNWVIDGVKGYASHKGIDLNTSETVTSLWSWTPPSKVIAPDGELFSFNVAVKAPSTASGGAMLVVGIRMISPHKFYQLDVQTPPTQFYATEAHQDVTIKPIIKRTVGEKAQIFLRFAAQGPTLTYYYEYK